MGAHARSTSSSTCSSAPVAGRAAVAAGLTVVGLLGGAGSALAGEATSPADSTRDSGCSVGGRPAGGTGTGSPDGVITNGQCSEDEIEQAERDAETDGDPTTRARVDRPEQERRPSTEGNPTIVGGTGDGISSQSGTAQKVTGATPRSSTGVAQQDDEQDPALSDVL